MMIFFIIFLIITCVWLIFFDQESKQFVFNKSRSRSLLLFLLSGIILFIGVRGGGPIFTTLGSVLALIATFFSRLILLLPNILLALRIFPFFKANQTNDKPSSSKMTLDEAREILGVDSNATKEQIISAYKKAISRNHPDQGGSNYLAAQINTAKQMLINSL